MAIGPVPGYLTKSKSRRFLLVQIARWKITTLKIEEFINIKVKKATHIILV